MRSLIPEKFSINFQISITDLQQIISSTGHCEYNAADPKLSQACILELLLYNNIITVQIRNIFASDYKTSISSLLMQLLMHTISILGKCPCVQI